MIIVQDNFFIVIHNYYYYFFFLYPTYVSLTLWANSLNVSLMMFFSYFPQKIEFDSP